MIDLRLAKQNNPLVPFMHCFCEAITLFPLVGYLKLHVALNAIFEKRQADKTVPDMLGCEFEAKLPPNSFKFFGTPT
jgi:hypothetical protein